MKQYITSLIRHGIGVVVAYAVSKGLITDGSISPESVASVAEFVALFVVAGALAGWSAIQARFLDKK